MDVTLSESISRFRLELEQVDQEIRRLEDWHQRETIAGRDRDRGITVEPSPSFAIGPTSRTLPENNARTSSETINTVLLLQEEPSVVRGLLSPLPQYRLLEANTAEEALALFLDNGQQIDLLIASVTLHKSSGIEVALLLRSRIHNLPVILTSKRPASTWNSHHTASWKRLGSRFVVILESPFQDMLLSATVRHLLGMPTFETAATARPST
jgi:CheY-like chemotaxis protein